MKRKFWTDADLDYLKTNYPFKPTKVIARHLGFTPLATRIKANRLGYHKAEPIITFVDKQARRRVKSVSEGKCPRCGKPAAPFYLCPEHREYERSRGVDGRPRKFIHRPHRKLESSNGGLLTTVGHITTHRMLG